jgi:hypothetical protein
MTTAISFSREKREGLAMKAREHRRRERLASAREDDFVKSQPPSSDTVRLAIAGNASEDGRYYTGVFILVRQECLSEASAEVSKKFPRQIATAVDDRPLSAFRKPRGSYRPALQRAIAPPRSSTS